MPGTSREERANLGKRDAATTDPTSNGLRPARQRSRMFDMRRRELLFLLGSAATWPLVARAQPSAMPVIGLLSGGTPDAEASNVSAFRQG
ncbi:MAG: hypothetical protein ACXU7X_13155, partial [Croceibacterium sp.]